MNTTPTTTRTTPAYPVSERTARGLRYTESTTGATLGSWDTTHAEGWTSDGRNWTNATAMVEHVNHLAGWR